jgi:hypothetical protein
MRIVARWLTTGRRLKERLTIDEILNANLAAGRLVVGW